MIQGLYYSNGQLQTVSEEQQFLDCLKDPQGVLWLDFNNSTADEWILLDEVFHFHPLAISDSMTAQHSPKINLFGDHLFMVAYAMVFKTKKAGVLELDLFLGPNYVITIHKGDIACLQQARAMGQKIFELGSAFLMHYILDTLVEDYMPVVERLNAQLDKVEQSMAAKTTNELLQEIFNIKKELINLRQVVGPMRDTINRLTRDDIPLLNPKVRLYFRDTYEQLFRVAMLLDTFKDLATSAQEMHLSLVANKNNEIIKTLTIITTIILPLSLITSFYGMNFVHMPELHWEYGHLLVLTAMALLVAGSIYYFRRRHWF